MSGHNETSTTSASTIPTGLGSDTHHIQYVEARRAWGLIKSGPNFGKKSNLFIVRGKCVCEQWEHEVTTAVSFAYARSRLREAFRPHRAAADAA